MKILSVLALSVLSVSAHATADQATIDKLMSTQFTCQLDRLEQQHGLQEKRVFVPERQLNFTTKVWGKNEGKCLMIPANEEGTQYMDYGCVSLNEKTVAKFDDETVKIVSPKASLLDFSNWGTVKIDLKTGKGKFTLNLHYGWHPYTKDQDHITAEFSHCEITER